MIRPPPLQLKLDNRFPHPVRTPSQPKSKSFVSQLYKASWKNPIIAVAGLNGLRFAFASHNAFLDAVVDDAEVAENLTKVSIALGVMYMIAFLIEIYGIIGVSMQRLSLIRVYLYLTFFASALVTGAGVLNGVSYFAFAEELMWECISLATEGRAYEKSLFRSRPWPGSVFAVRESEARKQCVYAWVHQSWSQVASVFLFSLVPAVIYYLLVYTYYRQTTDPKHSANLLHNRSGGRSTREATYSQVGSSSSRLAGPSRPQSTTRQRAGASRRAQVQRSLRGVGVGASTSGSSTNGTAAVVGAKRTFTSRSLKRDHRPPPLLQSPSPVGLGLTPGPPSYRPSRVYAAFAAPVPSDSEYDKFV
ncbi:hypothetical protein BDZ97DRAFT_1905547 [Flammula alnicola]|nr:hypothetical protein BDZ97DRAFT_1905547 [Flammula alnicola]